MQESRQFHFVFVLDESGSMSGTPFAGLQAAYSNFLSKRKSSQGLDDYVSVILFSSTARRLFNSPQTIKTVPTTLDYRSGGTNFIAGLQEADNMIAQSRLKPIMIFMSDGEDGNAATVSAEAMRKMKMKYNSLGFIAHTIAFGGGHTTLSGMAKEGISSISLFRALFLLFYISLV